MNDDFGEQMEADMPDELAFDERADYLICDLCGFSHEDEDVPYCEECGMPMMNEGDSNEEYF